MKYNELVALITHETCGRSLLQLDHPHLPFLTECDRVLTMLGVALECGEDADYAEGILWDLLNSHQCFHWMSSLPPSISSHFLFEETETIDQGDKGMLFITKTTWRL